MPGTEIDWPTHINNWRASGLTQAEYCRQNALKPYMLTYWKKRVSVNQEVGFVDITPAQPPPPPLIEIKLYEGFRFKINFNLRLSWDSRIKER